MGSVVLWKLTVTPVAAMLDKTFLYNTVKIYGYRTLINKALISPEKALLGKL